MAHLAPPLQQVNTCLKCLRQLSSVNGSLRRLLSSTAVVDQELQKELTGVASTGLPSSLTSKSISDTTHVTPFQEIPEYMQKWGTLDPQMVENKKQERRLVRREHVQPVGSRRRRAALRRAALQNAFEVPFEQLPYQCFQEARKILLEDRKQKTAEIEMMQARIKNVIEQDASLSGGPWAKEARLRSMRNHLNDLVILADINDPVVKRKFEDGQGTVIRDTTERPR